MIWSRFVLGVSSQSLVGAMAPVVGMSTGTRTWSKSGY